MRSDVWKLSLNCPFCDEPSYQKKYSKRYYTDFKIYTLRECSMGHQFYSVEFVPENQNEIVDEINRIKQIRREEAWEKNHGDNTETYG